MLASAISHTPKSKSKEYKESSLTPKMVTRSGYILTLWPKYESYPQSQRVNVPLINKQLYSLSVFIICFGIGGLQLAAILVDIAVHNSTRI